MTGSVIPVVIFVWILVGAIVGILVDHCEMKETVPFSHMPVGLLSFVGVTGCRVLSFCICLLFWWFAIFKGLRRSLTHD